MTDQGEQYGLSWILHHVLDSFIGSRDIVAIRRRMHLVGAQMQHRSKGAIKEVETGSLAEGMDMDGSDIDMMLVFNIVIVMCPDQDFSNPLGSTVKTVFMMRDDAHSRPGYVTLELVDRGLTYIPHLDGSIVRVGDRFFISSEMYKQSAVDYCNAFSHMNMATHGPAATTSLKDVRTNTTMDVDFVCSLSCTSWPREANEWVSRPRLHEWPDRALIDQIIQGGCHLVPVGDKTSVNTFLQWRISFATAEKKLIHSFTHTQFLIYGLFKYFLKQISKRLEQEVGEADIISSYIIKTVILYAVESTHGSLWQEKNTFLCFMLCLNILIAWVKAGYCPNYFINSNNMFLGKVHGENQEKLLHILIELHDMKWGCLSFGTFIRPSIGMRVQNVRNGDWKYILPSSAQIEMECDMEIFIDTFRRVSIISFHLHPVLLAFIYESKLDIDESIANFCASSVLSCRGMDAFEKHVAAKGNKEMYKYLRKCRNLLVPLSSLCTSPGLLMLATYYYQTGNYMKTLELCGHMLSSFKIFVLGGPSNSDQHMYKHLYCGRGYTLLHKCQEVFVSYIIFQQRFVNFCPFNLHQELNKHLGARLLIPPLPYAVFLTFLCYHELGDTRRRHEALSNLQSVKYDDNQGGHYYWIVHNILGICHEMVGDIDSALMDYNDSLNSPSYFQHENPAMERIDRMQFTTYR
ncbi:uncharacterized protein LOC110457505 [Mizuhopecten yessoensis]|uniref:Cyclic GMP-AMP synthase n=1 Tax=Mizuhopecten yessoensis TaxID=6573 RepID=A0A210Q8P4_MIZYE|nr:uncharacterized protein LOC110457496 [Mizuhopecten yessoensis]XP_021364492.1 uncharacterized protein LOC110457505 [Mizuhopecten yessoensis]OWF45084.1 Cyclic GMP-AMP synthase [Mizuhopecten yessoensis]OWF45085.1 Cyclic GMP-AMP synthase [Mizuhopecten yessoensis]